MTLLQCGAAGRRGGATGLINEHERHGPASEVVRFEKYWNDYAQRPYL